MVAISPHQRFVEDNPSSLSLLDIFKSMSTQPYDCIEHYYQHLSNIQVTNYYFKTIKTLLEFVF